MKDFLAPSGPEGHPVFRKLTPIPLVDPGAATSGGLAAYEERAPC